jgi:hypothetical protein
MRPAGVVRLGREADSRCSRRGFRDALSAIAHPIGPFDIDWRRGRRCGNSSPIGRYRSQPPPRRGTRSHPGAHPGSLQQSKDVVATCDATVNVKTRAISRETAQRKMRVRPSLGSLPRRIASRALLVLVKRQRVNVDSTDIFGPEVPLYLAGARLLEMFPMVQLLRTVTLAVGGMSYAGQFNAMVVADAQGYPDIDIFTRCAQQELRTLAEVLRPLRTSRTSAT